MLKRKHTDIRKTKWRKK